MTDKFQYQKKRKSLDITIPIWRRKLGDSPRQVEGGEGFACVGGCPREVKAPGKREGGGGRRRALEMTYRTEMTTDRIEGGRGEKAEKKEEG